MKNGKSDFYDIYKNPERHSKNWSYERLVREQKDPELQKVHEKYYASWWPVGLGRPIANHKANGKFLDPDNRMQTGCKEMKEVEKCRQ